MTARPLAWLLAALGSHRPKGPPSVNDFEDLVRVGPGLTHSRDRGTDGKITIRVRRGIGAGVTLSPAELAEALRRVEDAAARAGYLVNREGESREGGAVVCVKGRPS